MNKYKVPAFTILEITVTMMLAAIVIGIAYTAFSIVSKGYGSYNVKSREMATVLRLNELLAKDFKRADMVLKDTAGLSFQAINGVVKYDFTNEYVLRRAAIIDTFKLQIKDASFSFENMPVDSISDEEELNRVDALTFNLLFRDEKIPYHYYKQYSSVNLLQRNPNAVD